MFVSDFISILYSAQNKHEHTGTTNAEEEGERNIRWDKQVQAGN